MEASSFSEEIIPSMEVMQSDMASNKPYIKIIEEPKSKVRFRYECEGRSAGSILGASSSSESKTFPTIKIFNYKGPAIVVVSCVSKDEPYRPHPHKLVGKEHCDNGIYTINFDNDDMTWSFTNLGIQCMKKKDIDDSLKTRETLKIDPFKTGFSHRNQISSINLNVVRLCFQVYLPVPESANELFKLRPIVSKPIYDAKSNSDLMIYELSHASAPVVGGMKMILTCDKVSKEDIKIRFFEVQNGVVVWEGYADFQPQNVHKQYAITFRTPPYINREITEAINVQVQLVNSKNSSHSEPCNFKFTPLDSGRSIFLRYRKHKPLASITNVLDHSLNILPTLSNLVTPSSNELPTPSKLQHTPLVISDTLSNEHSTLSNNLEKGVSDGITKQTVESDYALVDKTKTWPDVIAEEPRATIGDSNDKIDERFQELLNDLSNTNKTLQSENSFLIIEEPNETLSSKENKVDENVLMAMSALDEFNNNIELGGGLEGELDVSIEELDDFPTPIKRHLPRTEGYGSYTSLQLAMKNQYFADRNSGECYEDILMPDEIPDATLVPPPRPPSHTKPNMSTLRKSTNDKFALSSTDDSIPPLPPKRLKKSSLDRKLPSAPKRSFFSKFLPFKSRSKSKPSTPRERSLSVGSRNVGSGGSLNEDVMLTEAENYALYTSIAPHATQSEFDEASFYYSPVEGLTVK